jgi:hypothetical protein
MKSFTLIVITIAVLVSVRIASSNKESPIVVNPVGVTVVNPIDNAPANGIASEPSETPSAPRQFKGHQCIDDCFGHIAGYEWAARKRVEAEEKWSRKFEQYEMYKLQA